MQRFRDLRESMLSRSALPHTRANGHTDRNCEQHCDPDQHRNRERHRDCYRQRDGDADQDPITNGFGHEHRECDGYPNLDSHSNPQRHAYGCPIAHGDIDIGTDELGNRDANVGPQPKSEPDTHIGGNAYSHTVSESTGRRELQRARRRRRSDRAGTIACQQWLRRLRLCRRQSER